mmetsp:Transcript_30245/g.47642  ORF Transcript_30245/g.47642 Transcript_30245/m.47642 type:complete len:529 (+) Transcript_30245:79-1665(+)|eukprot:CAMPEP_0194567622 /NCGR_PEP_ID=MMETSP0292-20121207/6020_1 /TAXON_ID=39354 /ORGANISM="Heterosigma akashiwo, Strain CCMP2393" /LENGTH=528 /DNA_ID=CAMNT_0039417421 /DNA_START=88 /DNA_END=1674 /DNA_ORIENTATION=-
MGDGGTPEDYLWLVVLGAFLSVFTAYGIGANDVANAFSTSVGSKTISMKTAVIFAGFWEFAGAVLLGSHVTKTIRKGIADASCFSDDPELLMYGMMCVIFSTGVWLILATKWELPVSTTHSTVGGIIGMVIAAKGADCVTWYTETDTFPYCKGVAAIVVSWFLSPLLSAAVGGSLFAAIRTVVLRHENSYVRSFWVYPVLLICTLVVYIFFIIYKGAKGLGLDDTSLNLALALSFGIGGGVTLIVSPFYLPWLKKNIDASFEEREVDGKPQWVQVKNTGFWGAGKKKLAGDAAELTTEEVDAQVEETNKSFLASSFGSLKKFVSDGVNYDVDASVQEDKDVAMIHDQSEKFDVKSEEVFKWLQVFTACMDSFGHGANDVANSIGPYAAIYMIYKENGINEDGESNLGANAYWILVLGGFGIVLGLATYGYKIMAAIGVKMTPITPTRGFCIEVGATFVIVLGSRLEMPLSTTHCQVGSTMGVGAVENCSQLNWKLLIKVFAGWVGTLLIAGFTTGIIFAQGAFAPCAI